MGGGIRDRAGRVVRGLGIGEPERQGSRGGDGDRQRGRAQASLLLCTASPSATTHLPPPHTPLRLAGRPFNGFQGDVWALGVCLFMFVFGRPPFSGATSHQVSALWSRSQWCGAATPSCSHFDAAASFLLITGTNGLPPPLPPPQVYEAIQSQQLTFPTAIEISAEVRVASASSCCPLPYIALPPPASASRLPHLLDSKPVSGEGSHQPTILYPPPLILNPADAPATTGSCHLYLSRRFPYSTPKRIFIVYYITFLALKPPSSPSPPPCAAPAPPLPPAG